MVDPKYLYKFRSFRNERHKRILTDGELFSPSPDKFNDPFDTRIPIRYENFTKSEFIRYWTDSYKEDFPNARDRDIREWVKNFYKICRTPKGKNIIADNQEKIINEIRSSKVGVYSLTANLKSILSWSHYADSHRGFCVGFHTSSLRVFLQRSQLPLELGRVDYSKEYPYINAYNTSVAEKARKILWTKSSDWEYENEYRILWNDGANNRLTIPDGIILRVVLGCQVSPADRDEMISILKGPSDRLSLFQAKQQKNTFGLRFECVKYT
jgi:hypothetical protein